VNRIALVLLVLVSAVGCVAVAAAGMPVAKTQAEAGRVEAEASRLEAEASLVDAESELVDSQSVSDTQAALVEIAAAAIVNADTARSEAAGRADRIQGEYHQLVIESIRDRRRSWWPWAVVAVVAVTAAGVVVWSQRRPVVVVISPSCDNGDGVEIVRLPESTASDLIMPAVMRPRSGHSAIRRVGVSNG
jgi:hypothetical protein